LSGDSWVTYRPGDNLSRIAEVSDGWPFILAGLKTLLETGQPLVPSGAG